MNTVGRSRRARLQPARKREGAALLIVLFVLMMSTGTAVFALQSTQFEQRAAGSLQQAMRTKYVAEAATVSVLGLCLQMGTTGCTDIKRANTAPAAELARRQRFALPNYKATQTDVVYELTAADLPAVAATAFPIAVLPTDRELSNAGASGAASPYTPGFTSLVEKWEVPNPGETRQRYRLIVSTYGQLTYDTDNNLATNDDVAPAADEFRGAHESISATRAFFDVR